ncbi:MAG: hypothetical protein RSE41_07550, partial [Clostridia bacterium]
DVQELVVKNTLKVLHEVMDLHQQRKEINEDMIFCLQVAKMMYTTEVVDTRILEYIEEICILTKIYKDTKYRTTTYASPDTKNSLNEINNINLDCEDEESLEILQEIGARLGLEIKILDGELIIIDILAQLPGQMTLDDIVIIEDIQVKSKHQQAIDDKEDIVEEIKEMGTLSIKNRVEKLQYFFYGRKVDEIIANKIKTRWVNYIWNTNYMFGTIEESWNYFAADKLATEYKKIEKTNVGCDHFIVGDTLKVHDNKQGFITGVVQEIRSYSMPKNHSYIYAVIDGEEYNNFVEKIDNSNIEMDLKTLSSGTYGSLIRELNYDGDITYEMIDILTEELIKFMKNKSMNFNCWQDVFQEFKIATKVNTEEKINEILEYRVQYFTHQATSKGSGREKVYGESLVNAVTDGKGTITEKEWLTGIQNIINKYEDHQVYKEVCDDVKQLPYIQSYTESQLTRFILERYIYHYKKIKECLVNNSIDVIIKIDEEKEQENMNNNITSVNKLIKNIENYTQKKNKEVKDLTLEERTELAKKSIIDKYNTTTSRNLINTFNKFMEENGHKSEEKIKLTQFETSIGIDGIYTEEELKERIKGLENAQDKFIIWALFKGICGTKAADLLNLKTTDVDLVNNTITYGDKKIIMDDYFKELTIGAMEQIYYKKNNYTGEDVNSTIDYELNSSCPYIIKGKPNVKNNNGMNAFGFEGLRRRLSKLGELTESRFGMDLLGRSGMIWIMQQQQKEWTSSQIKEEIKNRGWKANSNVIYDLMREKYNMEKGNRWKNK